MKRQLVVADVEHLFEKSCPHDLLGRQALAPLLHADAPPAGEVMPDRRKGERRRVEHGSVRHDVVEHDVKAGKRTDMGNAVAHLAGADNSDLANGKFPARNHPGRYARQAGPNASG